MAGNESRLPVERGERSCGERPLPANPGGLRQSRKNAGNRGRNQGFCGRSGGGRRGDGRRSKSTANAGRTFRNRSRSEVLATRENADSFGKQLAAAAWKSGFAAAPRKAFLGDGSETNWSVWRKHFSHYTPILDFIHALCYVYAAAMAGRSFAEGWPIYVQWAQRTWSGQVPLVIAALQERLAALGPPGENEPEDSPRQRVVETLRYLQNQQSRMRYDEYRRQGLPITSCHIESTIKQINRRVKGSEKFWSEGGAEALLQLAADYLSESDPLTPYWSRRQAAATGQRHYQTAM